MITTWFEQSPILASSLISLFVFVVLLLIGWILWSRFRISLGIFYYLFSLFATAWVWFSFNNKYGLFKTWDLDLALKWCTAIVVFFAVWFAARVFSIFLWDFYIHERRKAQVPGLLRSVATVIILIATIMLIAHFVFGKELSGLLVASSVTAGILVFALQDFLGGLIAGITISIEPPFQVGDWVMLGDKEGEVVDINWRATTLRTLANNYLVVPNSIISKEQLINFYKPSKVHALLLQVGVEYGAPPTLVKETLISCALESAGVLAIPRPISRLINFGDFAITYDLKFFIEDHASYQNIQDEVMTRIWYNFRRKGIRIPFPIRDVFIHEAVDKKELVEEMNRARIEGFLRRVSIFDPLDEKYLKTLAVSGRNWSFGKGERVVKQGEFGNSLFLILQGSASVHVKTSDNGREIVVGNLQEGDFFGEKSLLTGEPRGATVIAETDMEVIEIEKKNLVPILEENPGILEDLSKRLAERQLVNEGFFQEEKKAEEVQAIRNRYASRFLQSMRTFFGL
jgi:small-conductance mechanosensitive channel/CRP-like cAMP-binding protein